MVFFILAFCSFVNVFVSLFSADTLGGIGYILALIALLQMVAWTLIGWMWETVMR